MRISFLFIPGVVLALAACKSSSSSCNRCPYESGIEAAPVEKPAVRFLAADSFRMADYQLIMNPFNISPLTGYSLLPLHQNIIDRAFDYEGVRYRRGGTSLKGMDCSGLVYTCFLACGISLPRSSADMAKSVHDISRNTAKAGDLIFFKTNRRHSRINHVGLVIEARNGELRFIHASIHNGVIVSSTTEDYYARTFAKVGRVLRT